MNFLWFLLVLSAATQGHGSKILAIMTVPSHSHHFWNMVYLQALAERGHEITYVSFNEIKNSVKNIRPIWIQNAYELQSGEMDIKGFSGAHPFIGVFFFDSFADYVVKSLINESGFQKFLETVKSEKFDLVVFDMAAPVFQLGAVDLVGKPPLIGITAFAIPPLSLDGSGTPYPIADTSHNMLPLGHDMNFYDRFQNWAYYSIEWILREKYFNVQDALMRQYFGENLRDIREILDDMVINMVNANWAMDGPFPAAPGLIPVGGLHLKKPKALPKELQKYLDDSPQGVVYFSLGSNIRSTHLEANERKILLTAFGQLAPVKVLWKWETDELPGKPDNVLIQKWFPQTDVLAHPNVRLFVTHGGMLSSQEAIYLGVPIIGIPVYLDQHTNVMRAVSAGYGESLQLSNLSTEAVFNTINKVFYNPSYKTKVQELSKIFKDQINPPLETAVYWTEYAIRHNGAKHLRPASKKLNWFQNRHYDILLVVFGIISIVLFISVIIVKILLRKVFKSKQKVKKQ